MKKEFGKHAWIYAGSIFCALVVAGFIYPGTTSAQIITEINYNPDGTDGGYEWIELFNNTENPISLEGYIFRESEQNHRLSQTTESLGWIMPPNGYAIIVDNPTKFFEKHPNHPGLIFDSSFSLLNTGELLEIFNSDEQLVFGVEYNPSWGGNGDGSTLGLLDGSWRPSANTPGYENTPQQTDAPETDLLTTDNSDTLEETQNISTDDTQTITPVSNIPSTYIQLKNPHYQEKTIKSDAGPDMTLMAGVPFEFDGIGYGLTGGILDSPEYVWNFGDGTRSYKNPTLHTYQNAGVYVATLKITSGNYSHTDHATITVISPSLILGASTTADTLSLSNNSKHHIELSSFRIISGETTFDFPEESFIAPYSKIVLTPSLLNISVSDEKKILLLSSDDTVVASYHGAVTQIQNQISLLQEQVKETGTQDKAPDQATTETTTEPQIVYIGVPQYIEQEIETPQANNPSFRQDTQAATLLSATPIDPVIKKQLVTPFEILLIILAISGGVGYIVYIVLFTKKKKTRTIEIEEL